jgi:AcrR family transcriptional regulator
LFSMEGTEVALDRVARRAGVGNATLYRNFPSRGDLLVAVYAREVEELTQYGIRLLDSDDPVDALFGWLEALIRHMIDKRALAVAATTGREDQRGELFDRWHAEMRAILDPLSARACATGLVGDVSTDDLVAIANGIAIASSGEEQAHRLLQLARDGAVRR